MAKVTVTWLACHEFEFSTAEAPPCRGDRCTLNLLRLKRPPVAVVWKLGEVLLVKDYLEEDIRRMVWPARFSDLNTIENVRCSRKSTTHSDNPLVFKASPLQEWELLPQYLRSKPY
ncbi:hypothetical protein TNCV_1590291 [Trichonephila clavipes]|uniref:Uncharacterized protein n=1 Tax=Trichonephila clavipes TaxID=2585209 RepID=A0A8X6V5G5_TRICX|nr:hypothetical protein TNCV_1590291 [Trichonephila clavipes]